MLLQPLLRSALTLLPCIRVTLFPFFLFFLSPFLSAQVGKVGINTTSPAAMLHVADSSVLFTGPNSLPNPAAPLPQSGVAGFRFLWYADKAALRAGNFTPAQWHRDSIGVFSASIGGQGNKAKGGSSFIGGGEGNVITSIRAFAGGGFSNTVTGAHAFLGGGVENTISGVAAFGGGGGLNAATGTSSAVIGGAELLATGVRTFLAGGEENTATGPLSAIVGGRQSTTTGLGAFIGGGSGLLAKSYAESVFGTFNTDYSPQSITQFNVNDRLFVIGNGTDTTARHNAVTVMKSGRVGICTDAPAARLHVMDSSVLFTGPAALPANPGPPPVSGTGTRMMWYPEKAALRAGGVNGTEWDMDSIGLHSVAFGQNAKAKGSNSFVGGGFNNAASGGKSAVGGGAGNTASGINAFIGGGAGNTAAHDDACVGGGSFNTATGAQSFMGGGSFNATSAFASFVGGGSANTASGSRSFVGGGQGNNASGLRAFVGGGELNTAAEPNSFVGGGTFNTASGPRSFVAGGSANVASGNASFIGGGDILFARSFGEAVFGLYNTDYTPVSTNAISANDRLFVIGNGTNTNVRSNAVTVLKNGRVGIGTDTPDLLMELRGDSLSANAATLALGGRFGDRVEAGRIRFLDGTASTNWRGVYMHHDGTLNKFHIGVHTTSNNNAADDIPIITIERGDNQVGIGTTTPGFLLEVNGDAGKPGGGSWSASSDARLKTDIAPYTDGLDAVLAIDPVTYRYNALSGYDTEPMHVGVIAQQLQAVTPYMVSVSNRVLADGTTGYLAVDNTAMTYMLINAVKEQQTIIEELKSANDAQATRLNAMEQELADIKAMLTARPATAITTAHVAE